MGTHNFKKEFGQNFLRNRKYAEKLATYLELTPTDTVIEVGPGEGMVTQLLVKSSAQVLAIELDYNLLPTLVQRFSKAPNFKLLHADILDADLERELMQLDASSTVKVIGSLPYNISKKIISKFIDFNFKQTHYKIKKMSFIVQEEVAHEYTAAAPRNTFLSAYIRQYADIRKFESIPAEQFYPVPKVKGGILTIQPKNDISPQHTQVVKLVKLGFISPRKTLAKNLKSSGKWSDEKVTEALINSGIKPMARAAEIENEKWEILLHNLS